MAYSQVEGFAISGEEWWPVLVIDPYDAELHAGDPVVVPAELLERYAQTMKAMVDLQRELYELGGARGRFISPNIGHLPELDGYGYSE